MEKITKADTARLIGIIITAYPNIDKYSSEIIEAKTNTWAMMFVDDDTKLVTMAVMKHIAISKWPPSIAEIRSIMVDIQRPDLIPPDIAWGIVSDYIAAESASLYLDIRVEFPSIVQRAVEIVGFEALKELSRGRYGNYRENAARQAFMETYTPMYERERQQAQIPCKDQKKLAERALEYGSNSSVVYVKKAMNARVAAKQKIAEVFNHRLGVANED